MRQISLRQIMSTSVTTSTNCSCQSGGRLRFDSVTNSPRSISLSTGGAVNYPFPSSPNPPVSKHRLSVVRQYRRSGVRSLFETVVLHLQRSPSLLVLLLYSSPILALTPPEHKNEQAQFIEVSSAFLPASSRPADVPIHDEGQDVRR